MHVPFHLSPKRPTRIAAASDVPRINLLQQILPPHDNTALSETRAPREAMARGRNAPCSMSKKGTAMTDKRTQAQAPLDNMEKDPGDWVTGNEPMTGAQRSYLKTLSEKAHDPSAFDEGLTKADASRRIEELQARTGTAPAAQANNAGEAPAEDEGPLESLGRAVSETVLGSQPDDAGEPRKAGD